MESTRVPYLLTASQYVVPYIQNNTALQRRSIPEISFGLSVIKQTSPKSGGKSSLIIGRRARMAMIRERDNYFYSMNYVGFFLLAHPLSEHQLKGSFRGGNASFF